MAYQSQGTKFFWSATTAQSSAVQIGSVTDFTGPGGQAAVIDITHLGSTAKEKMMGLRDEGQLTLTLNYDATNTGQVALLADRANRAKKKALIKFSDTSTHIAVFDGYCLGFSITGAMDNKVSANAVIEIDGAVTFSTG